MPPRPTLHNEHDVPRGDAEPIRDCLVRRAASAGGTNGADVVVAELGVAMRLAACLASLDDLVSVVIADRSDKQMVEPEARRVVTTMQHTHAFRDRPVHE